MEVFQKYFSRLVVGNAPQIFPGLNRSVLNPGNYQILVSEMRKVSHDVDQARKIAESIETANEDLFRDFDLSTFMEHFKLDALEKTILALAFKIGSRSDLKTKGAFLRLDPSIPLFTPLLLPPLLCRFIRVDILKPTPFYPQIIHLSWNPFHIHLPTTATLQLPFWRQF